MTNYAITCIVAFLAGAASAAGDGPLMGGLMLLLVIRGGLYYGRIA